MNFKINESEKKLRDSYYTPGTQGLSAGILQPSVIAYCKDFCSRSPDRCGFCALADVFRPYADPIRRKLGEEDEELDEREKMLLRLVSHAYAHLGKIYSEQKQNPEEAEACFDLSIEYRPDEDPIIYHMAGTCLWKKPELQWRDDEVRPRQEAAPKLDQYVQDIKTPQICLTAPASLEVRNTVTPVSLPLCTVPASGQVSPSASTTGEASRTRFRTGSEGTICRFSAASPWRMWKRCQAPSKTPRPGKALASWRCRKKEPQGGPEERARVGKAKAAIGRSNQGCRDS